MCACLCTCKHLQRTHQTKNFNHFQATNPNGMSWLFGAIIRHFQSSTSCQIDYEFFKTSSWVLFRCCCYYKFFVGWCMRDMGIDYLFLLGILCFLSLSHNCRCWLNFAIRLSCNCKWVPDRWNIFQSHNPFSRWFLSFFSYCPCMHDRVLEYRFTNPENNEC